MEYTLEQLQELRAQAVAANRPYAVARIDVAIDAGPPFTTDRQPMQCYGSGCNDGTPWPWCCGGVPV